MLGIVAYAVAILPARDLTENGVHTLAYLQCYDRNADCHHQGPYIYTYVVRGTTYEAPWVTSTRSSGKIYAAARDTVVITYSSTDPKRWTFGPTTTYRDAVVQSLIFVLVGATIVSYILCSYVEYGSGLDAEAA